MKRLLRSVLVSESRAYGFTIAFWGSGALLVNAFGIPGIAGVLAYGTGAVTGFGILTLWAYRGTLTTVETDEPDYLVLGMIHYLAAIVPVLCTYFLSLLEPLAAFFLSGAAVSVTYNLGMLVEEWLSEEARTVEKMFT